jgi:hypothetical protein
MKSGWFIITIHPVCPVVHNQGQNGCSSPTTLLFTCYSLKHLISEDETEAQTDLMVLEIKQNLQQVLNGIMKGELQTCFQ